MKHCAWFLFVVVCAPSGNDSLHAAMMHINRIGIHAGAETPVRPTITPNDGACSGAATADGKPITTDIDTAVVEESSTIIPVTPRLSQNSPNPFSSTTTFKFFLPENSHVTFKIFNALGIVFAGTDYGVYMSADTGAHWTPLNNGLASATVEALAYKNGFLYAGTAGGGMFLLSDSGAHWAPINNGIPIPNANSITASGGNLYAGTGGGVFRSEDSGATWAPLNNELILEPVEYLAAGGQNIFAGANDGFDFSTDGGAVWMNGEPSSISITALLDDGMNVYAAIHNDTSNAVIRSSDNGATWNAFGNWPVNSWVSGFATDGTNVFAGTSQGGVYIKTGNNLDWVASNDGLLNL